MIYVTQGHELGVGLEVFLKAIICLPKIEQKKFTLIASYNSLEKTLKTTQLNFEIKKSSLILNNNEINLLPITHNINPTTDSLFVALEKISNSDILLTLPSSKDQILINQKQKNGYTEFLREYFKKEDIGMSFLALNENILLLTDHVSIKDVPKILTQEFIFNKVALALFSLKKIRNISQVHFSGIDPHCGENGLISKYDQVFKKAIKELSSHFPEVLFVGPYPGDTLHNIQTNKNKLIVYSAHDQGLAPFKLKHGLLGINLSLGLPFYRVSVDHGTAFDLFGKDCANYQGMLYLLNEIVLWT